MSSPQDNVVSGKQVSQLPAIYRKPGDTVFKFLILFMSGVIIFLALGMGVILWIEGAPTFSKFGYWDFLVGTKWDPIAQIHGALPFIIGTFVTSLGAIILAIIPAIGVAIFVSEFAPKWLAELINYAVDLLAAIPSVVIGLWAIFNFAPVMREFLLDPIFFGQKKIQIGYFLLLVPMGPQPIIFFLPPSFLP